jgi:predicted RNA binding protein YcfA (HicA-like mRNA interferase family)
MPSKLEETTVTVPVQNHKELKVGVMRSITRQSGLRVNEFKS